MSHDPKPHHRRSARLAGYDYATQGAYFVTLVAANRARLFGHVRDGAVRRTATGHTVEACWLASPQHFPHVALDAFVVMPNHFHGILFFEDSVTVDSAENKNNRRVGARYIVPSAAKPRQFGEPRAGDLATVIRTFKAAVSRQTKSYASSANGSLWQRNYYEKIIRNARMLNAIRAYIEANPANWEQDEYGGR